MPISEQLEKIYDDYISKIKKVYKDGQSYTAEDTDITFVLIIPFSEEATYNFHLRKLEFNAGLVGNDISILEAFSPMEKKVNTEKGEPTTLNEECRYQFHIGGGVDMTQIHRLYDAFYTRGWHFIRHRKEMCKEYDELIEQIYDKSYPLLFDILPEPSYEALTRILKSELDKEEQDMLKEIVITTAFIGREGQVPSKAEYLKILYTLIPDEGET